MSRNSAVWCEHAKCAGKGDLFFDDLYEQQAKAICADCPVREQCLDHAVRTPEQYGVWGGMTPQERRRMTMAITERGSKR